MAAVVSGTHGAVTFPTAAGGQSVQITEWTATIDRDVHNISSFDQTTNWMKKQGGLANLTGSATGYFDADAADLDKVAGAAGTSALGLEDAAPTASCILTAFTSKTFTFSGIISNVTTTVVKTGGPVSISFNFESSGTVTEA